MRFPKRLKKHSAAVAVHMMFYNFSRIHQTLKVTPAMAAGVTSKLWEIEDIIALLDNENSNRATTRVLVPLFGIVKR